MDDTLPTISQLKMFYIATTLPDMKFFIEKKKKGKKRKQKKNLTS